MIEEDLKTLKKFMNEHLFNKNGKIEGQRLKRKYFQTRSIDYSILEKYNIHSTQDLYNLIHNETEECPTTNCDGKRRFKGFRDGYISHCETCARTEHNWLKKDNNKDYSITLENVIDYIKDVNGAYNTTKIKKVPKTVIQELKSKFPFLKNPSNPELFYCFENNVTKLPICKICKKEHQNFYSGVTGYLDVHKGKCAMENAKLKMEKKLQREIN